MEVDGGAGEFMGGGGVVEGEYGEIVFMGNSLANSGKKSLQW